MDTSISQVAFQPQSRQPVPERMTSQVFLGPIDDERNERLYQISQVMARLTRAEKQNHKILALIFALTISLFAFLLMDSTLFPKSGLLQITQIPGPVLGSEVKARPGPGAQITGAVAGNYVGLKTSNQYHLPDCEAAKTGTPEVLTPLNSLTEAKRRGFKPCPVCQPSQTD